MLQNNNFVTNNNNVLSKKKVHKVMVKTYLKTATKGHKSF